jgi:flagellar FliL protein
VPSSQLTNEATENKAPKTNNITIILLIAVFLISAGLIYFFALDGNNPGMTAAASNKTKVNLQQYNLEDIVINLADPGLRRYLRTRITLEYSQSQMTSELNNKAYRIRDSLIMVLRNKMTEDLQHEEVLKLELLAAINSQLDSGQVEKIYFEEFLIQ